MASFTDILPQFNPYVQQLPVEAMVEVGMEKQKRYDEGIQKIQSQIDQVTSMDIYKDGHRQYLQSKMDELGTKLGVVAGGDFSNSQLVTSVGSMVKSVAKDPIVQMAYHSTRRIRKAQMEMESDKQAGLLTPDNQYAFDKQLSEWANDPDLKKNFRGEYVPHFDVFKFAKETFDEVLPDGMSFDEIYQMGPDGKPITDKRGNLIYSPTMTRLQKEGKMPEKVRQTIAQIFSDPRVARQLNITGQYNYRGLTPDQLSGRVDRQRQEIVESYQTRINELTAQQSLGKDVTREIDQLRSAMNATETNYSNYAQSAYTNPDGVRGMLYADDVSSRYTTMFGQIKETRQIMENPGWRTQFDMQKEANAQSRFAQELHQRKLEHRDDMAYKQKSLEQDLMIAGMKSKAGVGAGLNGSDYEKADELSTIDVIRLQATNFDNASRAYQQSSDALIWQTIFSKDPEALSKMKTMMNNGLTREQAIAGAIDELAVKANLSPEAFRATWVDKSIVEYNKLTPEQKQKNSLIGDAYKAFQQNKKIFDSELVVKRQADEQRKQSLGELGVELEAMEMKPQKITYLDKEYDLTKADIFDLAIYSKGMLKSSNILGNAEEVKAYRNEARQALNRLTQRGKGDLAKAMVEDEKKSSGTTDAKGVPFTVKDVYRAARYESETFAGGNRDWSQVKQVEQMITNKEYGEALVKTADIIRQSYGIRPSVKAGLLTGDTETDKNILYNVRRWAGEYGSSNQNLSGDFKNFAGALSENVEENNIGVGVIMDGNNNPQVEIIAYDKKGKRAGGMTIQADEALQLGIDINSLYENREISSLRNKIQYNDLRTSAGDPSELATYLQGDAYFDTMDFPRMESTDKFEVKANIVFSNGKYYPYLYMTDGVRSTIEQLDGDPSLQKLVMTLKNGVTPALVNQFLSEK